MRTLLTVAIAVAVLVSFTPTVLAQSAEDEAAIRKTVEQFWTTANKREIEAHCAMLDENVENWTGSISSRAAYEEYWSEWWERQKNVQHKVVEELGLTFVTPDVAVHKFRAENTGAVDADGKPLPPTRWQGAWVWVKKGGRWLLRGYYNRALED
jgi:ketosteroid isomerase-like protein